MPKRRPPTASLARIALEALTRKLILLDIAPGEALSEQDLCKELGVGRTPLREAIKHLEADHLVVTHPRRGTFASPVDMNSLQEVFEVRRALEPLAAELAAQRLSEEDSGHLRRIRAELDRLSADTSPRDLMATDMRIHQAIREAADNTHLGDTLEQYGNLATRAWSATAGKLHDVHRHITSCTPLLDAVVDGEGGMAAALMLEHLDQFNGQILRAMACTDAPTGVDDV